MESRDETATRALHRRTPPAGGTPPRRGVAVPLWLVTLIAVLTLGIGFTAGYLARGKTTDTPQAAPQQAAGAPGAAVTGQPVPAAPPKSDRHPAVGGAVALKGPNGEDITATLIKFDNPAVANHAVADVGKHFVSAEIRLDNHGSAAWNGNGAPTVGAGVIDTAGQHYGPILASTASGQMFTSHVVIEPGGTTEGVITFEIANSAKPASVQIVLDAGSGPVAQWQLS